MKPISDFFQSMGMDPFLAGAIAGALLVVFVRIVIAARKSEVLVDGIDRGGGAIALESARAARPRRLDIEVSHGGQKRSLTPEQIAAVENALSAGNKIDAIRILREATGFGLKESKELIDQLGRR